MDYKARHKVIEQTSMLGIITNLVIASVKIVIGLAVSSIAIITEGLNNASDVGSSFLTLVGTKLSAKKPDKKHPFGYGRIEYITSLVVGILIIFAGFAMIKDAVTAVIHPGELSVNVQSIIIVAVTAVIKFTLGIYTASTGKKWESGTLVAVGLDSRNDALFSILTIASSIIFLIWGFSLDAFVGIVFSVVVLKTGLDTLLETVGDLIGRSGKEELARQIYKDVRGTPGILLAVDMMIHSYGPDKYSGSVNIEVDHEKTVGDIYEIIHDLQLQLMQKYNITMVFGIYAVDNDHEDVKAIRRDIGEYVKTHEHIDSFHALYLSPETKKIYVDFLVDYDLEDWDKAHDDFVSYMKEKYPENEVQLTIETEFV